MDKWIIEPVDGGVISYHTSSPEMTASFYPGSYPDAHEAARIDIFEGSYEEDV
jgi:hypothetical protein